MALHSDRSVARDRGRIALAKSMCDTAHSARPVVIDSAEWGLRIVDAGLRVGVTGGVAECGLRGSWGEERTITFSRTQFEPPANRAHAQLSLSLSLDRARTATGCSHSKSDTEWMAEPCASGVEGATRHLPPLESLLLRNLSQSHRKSLSKIYLKEFL